MKKFQREALRMKTACLSWLRFDARCYALATEIGYFQCDVMGVNKRAVYEMEIKRTKPDFMNDFKKEKHLEYQRLHAWTPTYMYFVVPRKMVEWACDKLEEKAPLYGVMAWDYQEVQYSFAGKNHYINNVSVIKRAKVLNTINQSERLRTGILMRMGSDICRMYGEKMDNNLDTGRQKAKKP